MSATCAVCVTVVVRTYHAKQEALAQYEELRRTIEITPSNALDFIYSHEALQLDASITFTQQKGSSFALLFYGLIAVAAGFMAVTAFITLLQFGKAVYLRGHTRSLFNMPSGRVTQATQRKRDLRALSRQVILLLCCTFLAAGFIVAAKQQMEAVAYSQRTEALRQERKKILSEVRSVTASEPFDIKQVIERNKAIQTRYRSLISLLKKYPSYTSKYATRSDDRGYVQRVYTSARELTDSFSLRFPAESWLTLLALTLLGGILAVAFYGLLRLRMRSISIKQAPGSRFRSIVTFLYSQKTVEEVFDPLIADWRFEYFEALDQKRRWKARWISVRYVYSLLMAMGLSRVFSFFKVFTRAGK